MSHQMEIWFSVCVLYRAKLISSSDSLFFREVDILKSLFSAHNYPHISLIKYSINFLRFHAIILKKMKTAMNVRGGFLKFCM